MEYSFSVADLVGFFGTAGGLFSYALLQKNKDFAHSITYPVINMISSSFIIISLIFSFSAAAFVSQCIWVSVGFYTLYRAIKRKRDKLKNIDIADKKPLNYKEVFLLL